MAPYGEPDWATPGDTTTTTVQQAAPTAANPVASSSNTADDSQNRTKMAIVGLSILDLILAALMATLGVTALIDMNFSGLNSITEAFLAIYMVIFAVLLAVYEFIWWQPIASLNKTFRKNFGFMYGLKGKGFYLIFVAFLTFGLWKDDATAIKYLDWATGLSWLGVGFLHVNVGCCWPDANDIYKPATAGLADGAAGDNVV